MWKRRIQSLKDSPKILLPFLDGWIPSPSKEATIIKVQPIVIKAKTFSMGSESPMLFCTMHLLLTLPVSLISRMDEDLSTDVFHLPHQSFVVFLDPTHFLACGVICTYMKKQEWVIVCSLHNLGHPLGTWPILTPRGQHTAHGSPSGHQMGASVSLHRALNVSFHDNHCVSAGSPSWPCSWTSKAQNYTLMTFLLKCILTPR